MKVFNYNKNGEFFCFFIDMDQIWKFLPFCVDSERKESHSAFVPSKGKQYQYILDILDFIVRVEKSVQRSKGSQKDSPYAELTLKTMIDDQIDMTAWHTALKKLQFEKKLYFLLNGAKNGTKTILFFAFCRKTIISRTLCQREI